MRPGQDAGKNWTGRTLPRNYLLGFSPCYTYVSLCPRMCVCVCACARARICARLPVCVRLLSLFQYFHYIWQFICTLPDEIEQSCSFVSCNCSSSLRAHARAHTHTHTHTRVTHTTQKAIGHFLFNTQSTIAYIRTKHTRNHK